MTTHLTLRSVCKYGSEHATVESMRHTACDQQPRKSIGRFQKSSSLGHIVAVTLRLWGAEEVHDTVKGNDIEECSLRNLVIYIESVRA